MDTACPPVYGCCSYTIYLFVLGLCKPTCPLSVLRWPGDSEGEVVWLRVAPCISSPSVQTLRWCFPCTTGKGFGGVITIMHCLSPSWGFLPLPLPTQQQAGCIWAALPQLSDRAEGKVTPSTAWCLTGGTPAPQPHAVAPATQAEWLQTTTVHLPESRLYLFADARKKQHRQFRGSSEEGNHRPPTQHGVFIQELQSSSTHLRARPARSKRGQPQDRASADSAHSEFRDNPLPWGPSDLPVYFTRLKSKRQTEGQFNTTTDLRGWSRTVQRA